MFPSSSRTLIACLFFMKITPLFFLSIILCLAAGCASTAVHRERQYPNDWNSALSQRIQEGVIAEGDTRQMVYVAYGPPLYAPFITSQNLERWQYLGKLQKLPEMLEPPKNNAVCFSTTNDFNFQNPFQSEASLYLLAIDFSEDGRVFQIRCSPAPEGSRVPIKSSSEYRIPEKPRFH